MAREQNQTQNRPSIVDLCAASVTNDGQGTMVANPIMLVFRKCLAHVTAQQWPLPFLAMIHGYTMVLQHLTG